MFNYYKHLPLVLFTLMFGKTLCFSYTWQDLIVLAVTGLAASFFEFQIQNEKWERVVKRGDNVDRLLENIVKKQSELETEFNTFKFSSTYTSKFGLK